MYVAMINKIGNQSISNQTILALTPQSQFVNSFIVFFYYYYMFSPDDSASGMLFTIFYAFYGIIIIGIFLGILGDVSSYLPYHIVSAMQYIYI